MKSYQSIHVFQIFLVVFSIHSFAPSDSRADDFREPVVARIEMRLQVDDQLIDVIEKGDLLTVLEERDDSYVVYTFKGKKAVVANVNVLKLAESVEVYDELLADSPKEHRLYTLRASAWWARGDETQALADYDRAIQLGYETPEAYSSRGMFHAALGNYELAIADYTKAIRLGAKDESPYINRAAVYMTQQRYHLALADYDQAIRINPKKPSAYQQRAVVRKVSGQLDKAIEDFGKALELDPNYVPALMGRGYIYFQMGDHGRAIDDFTSVIKIDPYMAQAYNNRGFNRQLMGDYRNALADFEEAIRIAPSLALAYQNKAWLLAIIGDEKLRDYKQAIEAATQACELNNYRDAADLRALAASFAAAKQFEKAIGWQEKVIEMTRGEEKVFERQVLEKYKAGQPFPIEAAQSKET
jgi:tetratricopeptide (TPR) repeat protein